VMTARYRLNGGPIIVGIEAKQAAIGISYELRLFSPDMQVYFPFAQGNSQDTQEDNHPLPGKNQDHDQRVVEAFGSVGPFTQGAPYRVEMSLTQDGRRIGGDADEDAAQTIAVPFKLQVRLQGE
jgi:hypothetical protein